MDVIADTNILFTDFHLRGNRFSSLFDYLKRIDGRFVVLDLVKTEFLASYRREFEDRRKKSESSWNSLQSMLSDQEEFSGPEIEDEIREVERHLATNSNGVKVVPHTGVADISEVVRRGAQRVPPANEKGEELRDVIIWLSVLHYAKHVETDVAFISKDRAFWDGRALKQSIQNEVDSFENRLKVYPDLDAFIEQNNLQSTTVDLPWITRYIDLDSLKDQVASSVSVVRSIQFWQRPTDVVIDHLEFASGTAYTVGPSSMFVEFKFNFKGSAKSMSVPTTNISFDSSPTINTAIFGIDGVPMMGHKPTNSSPIFLNSSDNEPPTIYWPTPSYERTPSYESVTYSYPAFGSGFTTTHSNVLSVGNQISLNTPVIGQALFSLRIADGTVQKIDLDNVLL